MAISWILTAAVVATVQGFPAVTDTSFTAHDGTRTQRLSATVAAPAARVWRALSTAEGWRLWAVKTAYVDFREGGVIETSYTAGRPQGDRDNIKNQIVAYEPERLLLIQNVQTPRDFKDPELFHTLVTSVKLEPQGEAATRVTISQAGYGAGAGYDALYKHFLWGDAYSLTELKTALEAPAGAAR